MIYVSTACVKNKFIGESIIELAEMGFKHIELSGGTDYYPKWRDHLLELQAKNELKYSVHNYFPPPAEPFVLNFCSENEGIYQRSFALIKTAIDVSGALGADLYGFHPGYIVEMRPEKKGLYFGYQKLSSINKEEKEALFYKRFDALLAGLPEHHPRIAVENLFPFNSEEDFSLFSRPDEIISFLDIYADSEKVGLLLDLGHLNVASRFLAFSKDDFLKLLFEEYPHKVFEIHLSDNDGTGDHHEPTSPSSWQITQLKKYKRALSDALITVEWRPNALTQKRQTFQQIQGILN